MADQEHDIWFDRTTSYTLSKFHDDMAAKIIWGPSQTLSVWAVDNDSESKWSIRRDEHFDKLIKERFIDRVVVLEVDVVSINGQGSGMAGSFAGCASGVTTGEGSGVHGNGGGSGIGGSGVPENAEGSGDTSSSPPPTQPSVPDDVAEEVDWANLTILPDEEGFPNAAVDEDMVYEAMRFNSADERA